MSHQHLQPHEAQEEMREIFRRARDVPDMIQRLQKIKCRSCLQAVVNALKTYWHQQERLCHPLTGYYNISGQWLCTWHTIDQDLEILIHLTADQEQTTQQPPTNTTIQATTKTTTTMSLFVNRHEGTIHHNEYHNCTIYQTPPTPTEPERTTTTQPIEDVVAVPAFFRTDSQSISEIEKRWNKALEENTKTKVIRAVMQQDYSNGYFRLANLTNQERADEFNKAQNKFVFNASDFENASRK